MFRTIKRYKFNKIPIEINLIFKEKIKIKDYRTIISENANKIILKYNKISSIIKGNKTNLSIKDNIAGEFIVKIVYWYFIIFGIITVLVCTMSEMYERKMLW